MSVSLGLHVNHGSHGWFLSLRLLGQRDWEHQSTMSNSQQMLAWKFSCSGSNMWWHRSFILLITSSFFFKHSPRPLLRRGYLKQAALVIRLKQCISHEQARPCRLFSCGASLITVFITSQENIPLVFPALLAAFCLQVIWIYFLLILWVPLLLFSPPYSMY